MVPPTLPLQVGYVLLLVNMKQREMMRHMKEYPPGPRDQHLIPLVPLQVGHVILLVTMKKKKANENKESERLNAW
jgi:hypothetical protein